MQHKINPEELESALQAVVNLFTPVINALHDAFEALALGLGRAAAEVDSDNPVLAGLMFYALAHDAGHRHDRARVGRTDDDDVNGVPPP